MQEVGGSIPPGSTKFPTHLAQLRLKHPGLQTQPSVYSSSIVSMNDRGFAQNSRNSR